MIRRPERLFAGKLEPSREHYTTAAQSMQGGGAPLYAKAPAEKLSGSVDGLICV